MIKVIVLVTLGLGGVVCHVLGFSENNAGVGLLVAVCEIVSGMGLIQHYLKREEFSMLEVKHYSLAVGVVIMGILSLVNAYNLAFG